MEQAQTQDPSLAKIMPLVLQLMNKGGWNIVKDALDSQDPAQPLGRFLAEMVMKVATAAQEKGLQLDMKVFLRDGGVVETLLNMMEEHFDMPPEFSDEIFATLVKVIEQGLQSQMQGQQAQQGQPQQAPPQQGAPGLDQMGGM